MYPNLLCFNKISVQKNVTRDLKLKATNHRHCKICKMLWFSTIFGGSHRYTANVSHCRKTTTNLQFNTLVIFQQKLIRTLKNAAVKKIAHNLLDCIKNVLHTCDTVFSLLLKVPHSIWWLSLVYMFAGLCDSCGVLSALLQASASDCVCIWGECRAVEWRSVDSLSDHSHCLRVCLHLRRV